MKKLSLIILFIAFVTGVYAQQYATTDEIELYYDNGEYYTLIGAGCPLYWAVMFPSEMLLSYEFETLTKIALYEKAENTRDLRLKIYFGGDNAPDSLMRLEIFTPFGEDGFQFYEFETPVEIDGTRNLWIVFEQIFGQGDSYPASACHDVNGDPNGRWVSCDYSVWSDLAEAGMPGYTWMIRAYGTNILGVEEQITHKPTSVYPNPTTGQFIVEGANVEKVEVYNLVGQKVCEQQGSKVVNIDATKWNKGIYLVNIIEKNGAVMTKKLVVK